MKKPKKTRAQQLSIAPWPIGKVKPYAKNARKLSDSAVLKVARSIELYGWRQPIVVDRKGVVIAGHTRLKAAQHLGLKEVPVHVAKDLTEAAVKAYRLMDNRSHQESTWDEELLAGELKALTEIDYDLAFTGFEPSEIDALTKAEALADPDDVPEPLAETVSKPGDIWICGRHRVMCGDSTQADAVAKLMQGEKAAMVLTDPPYGVNIVKVKNDSHKGVVGGPKPYGSPEGVVGSAGAMYPFGGAKKGVGGGKHIVKPKLYAPVINDESTDTAAAFYRCAVAHGLRNFIIFGGNYFTGFLPPSPCWVVWDKQNSGNFADVEMAWTSFDRAAKLYAFTWNGLSRQGDRKAELATRVHPTQKPVGLIEKIFQDFSADCCYDGFLGSGSILIACEKTGRRCFGMELAPEYVDVTVRRWQAFTGQTATLEADGTPFGSRPSAPRRAKAKTQAPHA